MRADSAGSPSSPQTRQRDSAREEVLEDGGAPQSRDAAQHAGSHRWAGRNRRLAAALILSFAALTVVYVVAGRLTAVPEPIRFGDAPPLTPLTRSESIGTTRSHAHDGVASTRVRLPSTRGTQGAYASFPERGPRLLIASAWVRADRPSTYLIMATQQGGYSRASARPFVATSRWRRVTLPVAMRRGDNAIHIVILRPDRGGEETFQVDEVRVRRVKAFPPLIGLGDAPQMTPLDGPELIETTRAHHHSGIASTRVQLPAAEGTQGAMSATRGRGPQLVIAAAWVRAPKGRRYLIGATQQRGFGRATPRFFTATGDWQRVTLPVRLRRGDRLVHVVILRSWRGGTEVFDVDDVRLERPRRAGG